MLDRDEALRQADDFLQSQSSTWSESSVRLIPESAFIQHGHLIVPYNSIAFLDLGDTGAEMGGNLPIQVDMRTGKCSFVSFDEFLEYLKCGLFN